MDNHWKKGPLPKGTWGWGGITLETADPKRGFQFADFKGDHVTLPMKNNERVEAYDIGTYNNALTWPPIPDVKPVTGEKEPPDAIAK
jgi:hypothetical protein